MTALLLQAMLGTLLLVQDRPADSLPSTKPVVIRHVTVVDVGTGGLRPDMSVVIVAGRIAAIGAETPSPPGAEVFEGRGTYVIVRALKTAGVDFMKIHRRLPRDSYLALIDEAKKRELSRRR